MERCTRGKTIIVSAQLSPSSAGTIAETLSVGVFRPCENCPHWTELDAGRWPTWRRAVAYVRSGGQAVAPDCRRPAVMPGKNSRNSPNSQNPITFENAIGYAAINAHHNRFDITGSEKNGLDMVEDPARGPSWSVNFRASQNDCRMRRSSSAIRSPDAIRKRRRKHSYQTPSRSLSRRRQSRNGSIAPLLDLSKNAFVVIVGPSAPLSTKLFDFNVNAVSGYIAMNTDALIHTAMEGGAVSAMRPHGRFLTLMR